MGHVPAGPLREARQGDDVPGREHRGAGADGPDLRLLGRRGLGALGEDVAASFLARRGAQILGRNVRTGRGEIDLHVRIGTSIVAVEVKTVDGRHGARAEHQFTERKAAAVASAAGRLRPGIHRIDLIEVIVYPDRVDVRWTKAVA